MNLQATRRAVVFDFDGTLTRTDTLKFLILALLPGVPARLGIVAALVRELRAGRMPAQQFKERVLCSLLEGRPARSVERVLPIYRALAARAIRRHMWARLAEHAAGGDHVIVTGEVSDLEANGGDPLVFHRGEYRPLG